MMRRKRKKSYKWPTAIISMLALFIFLFPFNTAVSMQTETAQPATEEITDKEISNFIETELIVKSGVSNNNIDVSTTEGIVTLTGEVNNILAKERAEKIAEMVKGVRGVVNTLSVKDAEIADQTVKNNIEQKLFLNPATESYEVIVEVDQGKVSLEGTVESWTEKQLAEKMAKGVKGVRSIENKIYIEYELQRADSEITADVGQRLRNDVRVDDALIDVSAADGEVILTGTVGSAAEKTQAEIDAWVSGVSSVDASGLEVKIWARDENLRKDKYVEKSDEAIESAVKDAFLYDPRVYFFKPEVEVNNGTATLTGTVNNLKAKRAAEMTANNVVGVWDVTNLIKVRGEDLPADSMIESSIQKALLWDPYVERFEIDVAVNDGKAVMTGVVDTYYEKYQAEDVAATTFGVEDIVNNLKVSYDALPYVYDYEYNYYFPFGYDTYSYSPLKPDTEIKEDITDQIWWSPFVDAEEISVSVNNGTAVLSGTVDTWNEYFSAEENAFDGGALIVENNLEVEND